MLLPYWQFWPFRFEHQYLGHVITACHFWRQKLELKNVGGQLFWWHAPKNTIFYAAALQTPGTRSRCSIPWRKVQKPLRTIVLPYLGYNQRGGNYSSTQYLRVHTKPLMGNVSCHACCQECETCNTKFTTQDIWQHIADFWRVVVSFGIFQKACTCHSAWHSATYICILLVTVLLYVYTSWYSFYEFLHVQKAYQTTSQHQSASEEMEENKKSLNIVTILKYL